MVDGAVFAARRRRLLELVGEKGAAVFPAAPVRIRNNDVEHAYRQDSDLYYLTGFEEPHSVLVVTGAHPEHQTVLFVQPRDPAREVWDGPRLGAEGAVAELGVDAAFPIGELAERLPEYLEGVETLHYPVGQGHPFDARLFAAVRAAKQRGRRSGRAFPTTFVGPLHGVHEMRLKKDEAELEAMRRAAAVTAEAHRRAMVVARPGMHEYEVQAEMDRIFRAAGCERTAYDSIVGSGPNATILHYRANRRLMEKGDLLLIDAGCELDFYASDVTRTFPVSGRFTEPQRALYQLCLDAQMAAIDATKPGATLDDLHEAAARVIGAGLLELGLIEGTLDEVMEEQRYKDFFMHKTSHWIGMDVHDVGAYFTDGEPRPLEPGMVLTIEPGIYVATDAEVDGKWQGIGIRIEDDILVTEAGNENLTRAIPKTIAEIEALMGERRAA